MNLRLRTMRVARIAYMAHIPNNHDHYTLSVLLSAFNVVVFSFPSRLLHSRKHTTHVVVAGDQKSAPRPSVFDSSNNGTSSVPRAPLDAYSQRLNATSGSSSRSKPGESVVDDAGSAKTSTRPTSPGTDDESPAWCLFERAHSPSRRPASRPRTRASVSSRVSSFSTPSTHRRIQTILALVRPDVCRARRTQSPSTRFSRRRARESSERATSRVAPGSFPSPARRNETRAGKKTKGACLRVTVFF